MGMSGIPDFDQFGEQGLRILTPGPDLALDV